MQIPDRFSQLFQNKILLFQLSGLAILALVIIVIGTLLLLQDTSGPLGSSPNTTPTPISTGNFSTIPNNASRSVGIYDPISITFPAPLTPEQQRTVSVTSQPPILADREWTNSNQTLILTPQTALTENQQYSLRVSSPVGNYPFSFTATSSAEMIKRDLKNAGLTSQEVATKYPWYTSLPLFTGKYFVTFNLKTERFTAKLFISNPEQTAVLKDEVTEELEKIGVNVSDYRINWEVVE